VFNVTPTHTGCPTRPYTGKIGIAWCVCERVSPYSLKDCDFSICSNQFLQVRSFKQLLLAMACMWYKRLLGFYFLRWARSTMMAVPLVFFQSRWRIGQVVVVYSRLTCVHFLIGQYHQLSFSMRLAYSLVWFDSFYVPRCQHDDGYWLIDCFTAHHHRTAILVPRNVAKYDMIKIRR